jgi:hypothetical protein
MDGSGEAPAFNLRREAQRQKGHRIEKHGPGDYRCLCGDRLTPMWVPGDEEHAGYYSTAHWAARMMMSNHRFDVWSRTPEGKAFFEEAAAHA